MAIPNKPIKRQEQYLAKIAGQESALPEEPITRKEFYLAKAAGQEVETPDPITREEMYLDAIAEGGGGGSATLVDKTITANGEYDPADDSADGYSGVTVNVPNTYAAGDEGKVVSNGALVSQTSQTVSVNGTYDTTTKNSVTVSVGGADPYEIARKIVDKSITEYVDAGCTTIGTHAFYMCTNLTNVKCHNVTKVEASTFAGSAANNAPHIDKIAFPKMSTIGGSAFSKCGELTTFDCGIVTSIGATAWNGCQKLNTLIIRSAAIPSLSLYTAFSNTPYASGGSGGTIYIPKALYDHLGDGTADDYKSATNWSTVDGYGTITWAPIEGSYYETHYGDDTLIPTA